MSINTYINIKKKSSITLMTVAVAATTFIGFIDYITGYELRIDIFYVLPISFAVWYIGKRAGILISVLSILSIFFSDILSNPAHHVHFIYVWNTIMVFLFFIVVALSLSKLQIALYKQRELTSELRNALDDIKTTNASLEAFSSSVSHDLRGPLWRIEGFADMISDEYSDKLDEKGRDYLHRIVSNAGKMKDLIDALLKLSRYSQGTLNRSKVDLTTMVKQALEERVKSWPGRTVETTVADGVTAEGDPTLVQVIVSNLIGNAWKFTQHNPTAKIEFGLTTIDGKDVYFVRDNGAGFSMNNAKIMFNPFQRFHSESEFPGIGIGLATVQRIINRHGGRIWAESEVDRGATFYFTLS